MNLRNTIFGLLFTVAVAVPGSGLSAQDSLTVPDSLGALDSLEITKEKRVELELLLGVGFRLPKYDRVNGLSLPWGPKIIIDTGRFTIDPVITYRSHIGKFDPSLKLEYNLNSFVKLTAQGARGTFSNEEWIRPSALNSIFALLFGRDAQNYYRADQAQAMSSFTYERGKTKSTVSLGAQLENAWSTGWRLGEKNEPFAVAKKTDSLDGLRRANPEVTKGRISSGILEGHFSYEGDLVKNMTSARMEYAWDAPSAGKFTQYIVSHSGTLSTFADQTLEFYGRGVVTTGDPTPGQRFHYLGGSGTIPTLDMLERGGDRMFLLETIYRIPIPLFEVKFLGYPYIAPRFVTGAAGIRSFGVPTRNLGIRLGAGNVWLGYARDLGDKENLVSFGVSFGR